MAIHFDADSALDCGISRAETGIPSLLVFGCALLALFTALYHIYGGLFGMPEALRHRSTHAALFLLLTFAFYPLGRKNWKAPLNRFFVIDFFLIVATCGVYAWLIWDIDAFVMRAAMPEVSDIVSGVIFILLVFEAIRRTVGLSLVILPLIFILHALFADYTPSVFYAAPADFETLIGYLAMDLDAMLGVPVSVASTFIIIFMLFGSILIRTGAGNFFSDMAFALTGGMTGGPAKGAALASALYGTLSGSTAANVVTTGSFTIPLMAKCGFRPQFAASVEAIASNGGQIMPPIMGAAAFIIPMYIPGATYKDVALAAAIPAILYYVSLFAMIQFESAKMGLRGLPRDQRPKIGPIMKKGWTLIFSLMSIIVFLALGFTPSVTGVAALVVTIAVTALRRETRLTIRDTLSALEMGVRAVIPITMACLAAGLIIGAINLSGLSGRVTGLIVDVSQGYLALSLTVTMIVCIIMGMGMTTTIIYITLAALVVPSIVQMGASPMAANLFVFSFGCLSGVTPPVCLTTYAAAGIAHSNPWSTGWEAFKVGLASFIIPFMFVYSPALILEGRLFEIVYSVATSTVGVVTLAAAIQGYFLQPLGLWERICLFGASLGFIHPGVFTMAVALLLIALVLASQIRANTLSKNRMPLEKES